MAEKKSLEIGEINKTSIIATSVRSQRRKEF